MTRLALVLLLLACPLATAAAPRDPFDTGVLRPPAPPRAWNGPDTPDPCGRLEALPASISLPEALDFALCRNPRTRQSWAAAKVAAAQAGVAQGATLPSVTGTVSAQGADSRNAANAGRRDQLTGTLTFNYLLFDFGGRSAAIEQARQALFAADWTHNATMQTVVLDVSRAYYQLFAALDALDAARAGEQFAQQSLDAARARQKAGTATRADVLQAQTAFAQTTLARTQSEGATLVARGVLSNALGLAADAFVRLTPPPPAEGRAIGETALAELLRLAAERRPELRAAEANVAAARSAVTVEESAAKATVSLFANTSASVVQPGADPRSAALGLTLNIPIFLGYQPTYRIQAAREQVERQDAIREQLRNDISLEVWRAYQDVRTQEQAVTSAGDLVASASESYGVAFGRYRAGVGTVIDVLNAQTALIQASVQKIQARFNLNLAKIALARAIGALDAGLFADASSPLR